MPENTYDTKLQQAELKIKQLEQEKLKEDIRGLRSKNRWWFLAADGLVVKLIQALVGGVIVGAFLAGGAAEMYKMSQDRIKALQTERKELEEDKKKLETERAELVTMYEEQMQELETERAELIAKYEEAEALVAEEQKRNEKLLAKVNAQNISSTNGQGLDLANELRAYGDSLEGIEQELKSSSARVQRGARAYVVLRTAYNEADARGAIQQLRNKHGGDFFNIHAYRATDGKGRDCFAITLGGPQVPLRAHDLLEDAQRLVPNAYLGRSPYGENLAPQLLAQ